jgi:hypothetical protein
MTPHFTYVLLEAILCLGLGGYLGYKYGRKVEGKAKAAVDAVKKA